MGEGDGRREKREEGGYGREVRVEERKREEESGRERRGREDSQGKTREKLSLIKQLFAITAEYESGIGRFSKLGNCSPK